MVIDPTGQVQALVGREPKLTPELSGTWGAVVTLEDGFGNIVRSQTRFLVNNVAPAGLSATEATVVDDSLLRTYSGTVKDFAADRLQGKLIVQNDNNGSRLETPIVLEKQGAVDAAGIQTYTFTASLVLTEATGNVVSIEVVDQDGATVTIQPTRSATSSDDYSNASGYGAARHVATGPQLGAARTSEAGLPPGSGVVATGDEDGVTFAGLVPGGTGSLTADVRNVGTAGAQLDAWIDFNDNKVFDANEQVVTSQMVTASGQVQFNVAVPSDAKSGPLVARVRLSQPSDGVLAPTGAAQSGEVEDYSVSVGNITFDVDGSGNLIVNSASDRRDVINIASDGTSLVFTLDQISDVTLTAAFTAAGGSLNAVGKQVKLDLTKVTGQVNLNSGAGNDAFTISLGNNLPKLVVNNTSTTIANSPDRLTFTSTAGFDAATLAFNNADAGSIALTTAGGSANPVEFSGGALLDWQSAAKALTVSTANAQLGLKLRAGSSAGSFELFTSDRTLVALKQPTDSLTVQASSLDLSQGFVAPLRTTFDAGSDGTIQLAGTVDTNWLTIVGNITLVGNARLDSVATPVDGRIEISGNVDGAYDLALISGAGETILQGDYGASAVLTSLTTDALGTTQFKGGVLSAVSISINDPLTLTGSTAFSGRTLLIDKGLTHNAATKGQVELRVAESAKINQPIVQTGAGDLSFIQNGTGVTILQGANTFNGDTTIQLGELQLDVGASLSGNVILAGGKLEGKGVVKGTTTQAPGSSINPGASPGILAIRGDLQFADEGQLKLELNGLIPGTLHDQVLADGSAQNVDLGRVNLQVSLGYTPNLGDRFTVVRLADGASTLIGTLDDAQGNEIIGGRVFAAGGYQFEVNYRTDADGDGALNDVTFTVIDYARDFGSAPDSYHTTFALDGARHRLNSGLGLGFQTDAETDATAAEDNDGVVFQPLRVGNAASANMTVINDTLGNAMIDAWIDFDQNGSFDAGERIFTAQPVDSGLNTLQFSIPAWATVGSTYARVRLSSSGYLQPTGEAADGEVEDYAVTILSNLDLSDAPGYSPAAHIVGGPYLGQLVDAEASLSGSDDAEELADNDGVIFGEVQATGTAFVRVDAGNVGTGAKLDAWIDFNGDGDFRDSHEKIVSSLAVVAGRNLIEFELPAGTVAGNTYARFRISSAGGLPSDSPDLPAADGEVEDYALTILPTRPQIAGSTFITLVNNDLVVQDQAGLTDTFTVSSDGEFLIVHDPNQILTSDLALAHGSGSHTVRIPLAELADSIIIDTANGDDQVTIDLQDPSLLARIQVLGGAGHDVVTLIGADQTGATLNVTADDAGTIDLASGHSLAYQAEAIQFALTIEDLSLVYSSADDALELTSTPSGIAITNHGTSSLSFVTPSRLTIRTGEGADNIRLDSNGTSGSAGSVDFITFDMAIDAGGQTGDRLEVINSSDSVGDDILLTNESLVSNGPHSLFANGAGLEYFGLDSLRIDSAGANSTVIVNVDDLDTAIELNMAAAAINDVHVVSGNSWGNLNVTALSATETLIELSFDEQSAAAISVTNGQRVDVSTLDIDSTALTFSNAAETIVVADAGLANVTSITSSAGGGTSWLIKNPTTTLSIAAGTDGVNTVNVNGLGNGFSAEVAIEATGDADQVNWRASQATLAALQIESSSIVVDTDTISTIDEMRWAGPVTLARNVTLSGASLIFADSLGTLGSQSLAITAAHVEFDGPANLGSLKVQVPASVGDNTLEFRLSNNLTASGRIDIDLPLIITQDLAVSGTSLQFDTIDANVDASEGEPATLTLNGIARFDGDVGATFPLAGLNAQAVAIATNLIRTTGLQDYSGNVVLLDDVTIDGPADFIGAISGHSDLTTVGDVTIRAVNSLQGRVVAAAGSLKILGTLSSDVFVSNAILAGNGHIQGNVDLGAGGWLMPTPDQAQWLTIDGTLSFDSEAGFVLTGTSATMFGRVIAQQMELNGASLFDELAFAPDLGEQLSFLQATNMHGQFNDLPNDSFLSVGNSDALAEYLVGPALNHEFVITGYGDGDYGDAPIDSFKSDFGAVHRAVGPMLGSSRGSESDGLTGDQQDDGVSVLGPLVVSSTADTLGALTITASSSAKLDAWIDFNQDGDWDDAGEQIVMSRPLSAGANNVAFTIPAGAAAGDSYARFRLSTAGGLASAGIALDGEVEDYQLTFTSASAIEALTIAVGVDPTEIALEGNQVLVRVAGQIVSRVPASGIESLVIEGNAQNNSVTIDARAIPAGGLWLRGNGDGDFDTLRVLQSSGQVTILTHDFINAHDGSVIIDGKTIHYTGLEPIIDTASVNQRDFTFGDGDDLVTLTDADIASNGTSRLTSVDSSEAVDFRNPAISLTLDLGEGNNRLTLGSLDSGLNVPMIWRFGSGDDQLLAASGDLNLSGMSIQKEGGQLSITSRAVGSSFTTSGSFSVGLIAGAQFSNAMTFDNTGGVQLGDATSDVFDFAGGLTSVAGPTLLTGSVRANDKPIVLADVILNGNASLSGSTITLQNVTGTGNLTLTGNVILNGSIDIDGTLTINGTLTLGTGVRIAANGTTVLSSAIQGGFDIIYAGTGTLRLSNANFAGRLIAETGTVELPNGFDGQLIVSGGTATVAGSLSQSVTANAGTVRVGNAISSATLNGDLTLNEATTLEMQINGATAGTGYDQWIIGGNNRTVNLADAQLAISLGFTPTVGSSFTLISLSSSTSKLVGQFAGLPQNGLLKIGNSQFTIDYAGGDGNDVVLTSRALAALDFGDAPSSHGTLLEDDGARHLATGPTLGANRDSDVDGLPTDLADGDDPGLVANGITLNDDDGVTQVNITGTTVPLSVTAQSTTTFNVKVQDAPNGAKLDAWIDWDNNGIFSDEERIATRMSVLNGNNALTFTAPSEDAMAIGTTYARFRISSAGIDSPTGLALDGEVEDYLVATSSFDDAPTFATPTSPLTLAEDSTTVFFLDGITSGGEVELLQVSAVSANPDLFSVEAMTLTAVPGRAQLALSGQPNASGSGNVIVTVRSSGADQLFDTADDQLLTTTIAVSVTPVNDAPTGFAESLLLSLPENAGVQTIQLFDVSAGPLESEAVTLRVSTDKPNMFKSLAVVGDVEDSTLASLKLETAVNQRGTALVYITIDDGTLSTTQTVTVQVAERNDPPTFTTPATVVLDAGTTHYTLNVSDISAGPNENQSLQVLAFVGESASNATTRVTYTATSATGTIDVTFPANSVGNVNIIVLVQDAGADGIFGNDDDASSTRSVLFALTNAPTLDTPASRGVLLSGGVQTVALTGISDGDSTLSQLVRITATSSSSTTLDNLTIDYDADNFASTGQLHFTPLALGSAVISVNVTDAGNDGTLDTPDDRTTTRQFTVNVSETLSGWHNSSNPLDVNGDGLVLPLDVLLVVNELNLHGTSTLPVRSSSQPPYVDVNNDGQLQPLDALLIINEINQRSNSEGEGAVSSLETLRSANWKADPRGLAHASLTAAVDAVYEAEAPEWLDESWLGHTEEVNWACPMDEFFGEDSGTMNK